MPITHPFRQLLASGRTAEALKLLSAWAESQGSAIDKLHCPYSAFSHSCGFGYRCVWAT